MKRDQDDMSGRNPENSEPADDVATLYSWANLHGAKYKDFSASRQQVRTEMRERTLGERAKLAREEAQERLRRRQGSKSALGGFAARRGAAGGGSGAVRHEIAGPVRHEIPSERRLEMAEEAERIPSPPRVPAESGITTRYGLTGAGYFRAESERGTAHERPKERSRKKGCRCVRRG